jgi:hypothetical protein
MRDGHGYLDQRPVPELAPAIITPAVSGPHTALCGVNQSIQTGDKLYTSALCVLSLEVYYRYYLPLLKVR